MGRFDGAWEERGVIGPRVEIDGERIVFLWQASTVLETRFDIVQDGGKVVLRLEHNGLRNSGSLDPYAVINEIYYDGSALVIDADYRFSGLSEARLFPTTNSRYGNVTLVDDEILPVLQGRWESKYTDLIFESNTLSICGHGEEKTDITTEIVTARTNGYDSGEVMILDKNPANRGIGDFYSLYFSSAAITGCIQVCDADAMKIVFTKKV